MALTLGDIYADVKIKVEAAAVRSPKSKTEEQACWRVMQGKVVPLPQWRSDHNTVITVDVLAAIFTREAVCIG